MYLTSLLSYTCLLFAGTLVVLQSLMVWWCFPGMLHLTGVNAHVQPILCPGKQSNGAAWALPRAPGGLPSDPCAATGVSSFAFQARFSVTAAYDQNTNSLTSYACWLELAFIFNACVIIFSHLLVCSNYLHGLLCRTVSKSIQSVQGS